MKRSDLVAEVARASGESPDAVNRVIKELERSIAAALGRGERIVLPGFVTCEVQARPARVGRNPRTGEPLEVPAGRTVRLRPGSGLKDAVK